MVVEVVGVRPSVQTSSGAPVAIKQLAFNASGLFSFPVITITGIWG